MDTNWPTFSIEFLWMKIWLFQFWFHWSSFSKVQLMTSQHLLRYRVGAARQQAVICIDNLNQSNINLSSGLSELMIYDMFCFFIYKPVWTMLYIVFKQFTLFIIGQLPSAFVNHHHPQGLGGLVITNIPFCKLPSARPFLLYRLAAKSYDLSFKWQCSIKAYMLFRCIQTLAPGMGA